MCCEMCSLIMGAICLLFCLKKLLKSDAPFAWWKFSFWEFLACSSICCCLLAYWGWRNLNWKDIILLFSVSAFIWKTLKCNQSCCATRDEMIWTCVWMCLYKNFFFALVQILSATLSCSMLLFSLLFYCVHIINVVLQTLQFSYVSLCFHYFRFRGKITTVSNWAQHEL